MKHILRFPATYPAIKKRLNSIKPIHYGTRNFIDGGVTYLSPYISRGVISTKQVLDIVLKYDIKQWSVYKFIQELAWRDYYQLAYKELSNDILKDISHKQPGYQYKKMPATIINSTTGIEVIDELIEHFYNTGYMHNHVRMYTASITCNVAKTYWLQPSQWLYYYLLDGDIASNTCSWQWVAGSFSWKKYYCNQENINRYTHTHQTNTFLDFPYEKLVKMKVPKILKERIAFNLKTNLPATSALQIDTSKPTLIYNSYNLDPEWRKKEKANRILLLEPSHFKKFPVHDNVMNFIVALSKNIKGIQLFTGEVKDLVQFYTKTGIKQYKFISKEHPSSIHYPGVKDEREWMFAEVTGFYKSYHAYWKKADKALKKMIAEKNKN